MARLFANDGSVNDFVRVESAGLTAMPFGTIACVHRITARNPAAGHSVFLVGTDAQDFVELFDDGATGSPQLGGPAMYFGAGSAYAATTGPATGTWCLFAGTKTTGTVAPRLHMYVWPTNTWTHVTGSASLADSSGTGATANGIGFTDAGNAAFSANADILASAAWKNRAMTDSEIERLAAGMWSLYNPDLYMCFPSGRDFPTRTTVDGSRNRVKQTSVGSQVTRANVPNPPGFRIEPLFRRR